MLRRRRLMTRSRYALYRRVTKQAITHWQNKGYVVFAAPNLIDVELTDQMLDERPEIYRGGRTSLPSYSLTGRR